jgi:hypothetical protein
MKTGVGKAKAEQEGKLTGRPKIEHGAVRRWGVWENQDAGYT